MSEEAAHYGPNAHLHARRLQLVRLMRDAAGKLESLSGSELPDALAQLEPVAAELELLLRPMRVHPSSSGTPKARKVKSTKRSSG